MSRWKTEYKFVGFTVWVEWKEDEIINEAAHHWFRLGVPMEDLQIAYQDGRAPKLVHKSDFSTGKLVINDDHPMKWFYDRVENEDE